MKPLWLVERRHLIVAAVVEDIKRELFLTTDACGRGISQHVIYCDVPVSVLLVTVDWKLAPNMRNSYMPSSIMVMDLPGREMIPAVSASPHFSFVTNVIMAFAVASSFTNWREM